MYVKHGCLIEEVSLHLFYTSAMQFCSLNRAFGKVSNQEVGSSSQASPKPSVKQEPNVLPAIPKLTLKTDALERTVVSQTLSTTVEYVSKSF